MATGRIKKMRMTLRIKSMMVENGKSCLHQVTSTVESSGACLQSFYTCLCPWPYFPVARYHWRPIIHFDGSPGETKAYQVVMIMIPLNLRDTSSD